MRKLSKKLGIMLVVICCIIVFMPVKEIKAAAYEGTLKFGEQYDLSNAEGMSRYDFVLEESGRVTINFVGNKANVTSGVFIYDATMNIRYTWKGYVGSYKHVVDLKAGEYTLIMSGDNWLFNVNKPRDCAPNGTMVVNFTSAGETFKENLLETNDEYGVASEIKKLDKATIKGQFAVNDSVDYYCFDVKKSQKIDISYVTAAELSNMHIYKDSLDLEHWENKLTAGTHKVSLVFPAGHYYLSVESTSANKGNYTLKFATSDLSKVKLKSVTSTKAKTLKVSYGKANVNSYQIQISTNAKFTGAKTYSCNATSKTIKNLKPKTNYYVRVRTVSNANEYKCYSAWSAAKKVKVK